jgi:hypothetical protein
LKKEYFNIFKVVMSKENTNDDLILDNTHEHCDNLILQKYKYETIDVI